MAGIIKNYRFSEFAFLEETVKRFNNIFRYHYTEWKGKSTIITVFCPKHKSFKTTAGQHIKLKTGCQQCWFESISESKRIDSKLYVEKAKVNHIIDYEYPYIENELKNLHCKITIKCPTHGLFTQHAQAHMNGADCAKCALITTGMNRRTQFDQFIENIGDKYPHILHYPDKWQGNNKYTTFYCTEHDLDFRLTPYHFINSKFACPKCKNEFIGEKRQTPLDEWIKQASNKHHNRYDYSKVKQGNGALIVTVTCPDHGDFNVTRGGHVNKGRGCPDCKSKGCKQYSIMEREWLASLNISTMSLSYRLPNLKKQVVDGYDPITNTVYQFHGDWHHGNPRNHNPDHINQLKKETFGNLYKRTKRIEQEIIDAGYNLIVMWEMDYIASLPPKPKRRKRKNL
jgi:predicted Zn-ribbon and HTH transcriptional regulator